VTEVVPNVVVAADAAFCRQLAVVLVGLSRTSKCPWRVFVLHDGYDSDLMTKVALGADENISIEWISVESASFDDVELSDLYPRSTLFRLLLGSLLPDDVQRLIYLDSDTAVRAPLDELWDVELGDHVLAAVRDPVIPWAGMPGLLDWRTLGVRPDSPYFNAGVLVIPIERWRQQDLFARTMALMTSHLFKDADQGALNVVVDGAWLALDPRWNLQAGHIVPDESMAFVVESPGMLEKARSDPAVVHFNSGFRRRPWEDRAAHWELPPHELRDLWFEDLDHTAWAGWRPDDSRPSRAAGLLRRASKAQRALAGE
jgi:lipopolysaccharide biosynthesis glycosyltransferase